jgi:hypothetical protein
MSTAAHIFLRTGLPVERCAERLAEALYARTSGGPGTVLLHRAAGEADLVGAEVTRNVYADSSDGFAALDGFDTAVEVHATTGEVHAEARRMFEEIATRLPWPALLVFNLERLVIGYHPEHGRADFPPGTPVAGDHPGLAWPATGTR